MHEPPIDPQAAALVRERVTESLAVKQRVLEGAVPELAARAADVVATCLQAGGKLLLFGNGGSAADATHLAAEFVGRFKLERPALAALSLTDNVSSLTSIGNDYTYERIFARSIEALGRPGDVAIGFSTSGSSANVVAGLHAASAGGLRTLAFTGAAGGDLPTTAELCLCMPTSDTARVQECYMLVGHTICEIVERRLFAGSP